MSGDWCRLPNGNRASYLHGCRTNLLWVAYRMGYADAEEALS